MRKILILRTIFALIFLCLILGLLSCSGCEKKKVDILSIIPQDTQNIVFIPSSSLLVADVMQFFKIFENGTAFETLKKEIDLASQKLGINLLDKKSINNAGFDPDGSMALISLAVNVDGKLQNANLLIMPYSDRAKAENTLNRLAREKEKTEIFKSKSYMDARIITAIRQGPKGEKPVLVYAFYKGFVIYGVPEKGMVAIKKIVDTKHLNSMANYNTYSVLKDKVKGGHIYFFINSGKNIETPGLVLNKEMKKMLSSIRDNFNGMMLSFGISNKGIVLDSFVGLSDKAMENAGRYFIRTQKEEIEKLMYIVPEDPFFITKVSLNFASIYSLLKEENPYQMMIINKRMFGPMMKYMELDVEKDIIPLIKGALIYAVSMGDISNINRAIESGFKGEAFNKLFNVFYAMNLTDTVSSERLLERFVESMKDKGQEVEEHKVKNIRLTSSRFGAAYNSYWYIDEGNFNAFYSGKSPENIIRKPEGDEKKPVYKIPQNVYDLLISNESQVLYLSFSPFKKVLDSIDEKNLQSVTSTGIYKFAFILIKELLNKLDSALIYLVPHKDGLAFNISINVRN